MMAKCVSLFSDAAFDQLLKQAGGGIWVKYGDSSSSTSCISNYYIGDSCEAEFFALLNGIVFVRSQIWFNESLKIIATTDSLLVVNLCNSINNINNARFGLIVADIEDDYRRIRESKYAKYIETFRLIIEDGIQIEVRKVKSHILESQREAKHHINERVDLLAKGALGYARHKAMKLLTKPNQASRIFYGLLVSDKHVLADLKRVSIFTMLLAERGAILRLSKSCKNDSISRMSLLANGPHFVSHNRRDKLPLVSMQWDKSKILELESGLGRFAEKNYSYKLLQLACHCRVTLPSPKNDNEIDFYNALAFAIFGHTSIKSYLDLNNIKSTISKSIIFIGTANTFNVSDHIFNSVQRVCACLKIKLLQHQSIEYMQTINGFIEKCGCKNIPFIFDHKHNLSTSFSYVLKCTAKYVSTESSNDVKQAISEILTGSGTVNFECNDFKRILSGNGQHYVLTSGRLINDECRFKVYMNLNAASKRSISKILELREAFQLDGIQLKVKHLYINKKIREFVTGY